MYQSLDASRAQLEQKADLGGGLIAAVWSNCEDFVVYDSPEHYTLSCYLDGGYRVSCSRHGKRLTGGAPGKVCVMTQGHRSSWDIDDPLRFFHLYFDQSHLSELSCRIWDKPQLIEMPELTFAEITWVEALCRNVIMPLDWHSAADRLALSSAADMLMTYLLQHYAKQRDLPRVSGGLSPNSKRTVLDYIQANMASSIALEELAQLAHLSTYHFAHMFKHSMGESPHRYLTERRLTKARELVLDSEKSLKDIALEVGFTDQSHLGNKFKKRFGVSPAKARKQSL